MTKKLPGLMQDDFPLTLNHIRRRMRSCNQGAEVLTLQPDGSVLRATHMEVADRVDRLARVLVSLGIEQGERVATLRMEQPAPPRALLRSTLHRGCPSHPQHPALRGAADLHRQPCRGPCDLRRRLAGARAGETRAELPGRRALCGDGQWRCGISAKCAALRGAARAGRFRRPSTTPSSTSVRPRLSATPAGPPATPRACSTRIARSACTPRPL